MPSGALEGCVYTHMRLKLGTSPSTKTNEHIIHVLIQRTATREVSEGTKRSV